MKRNTIITFVVLAGLVLMAGQASANVCSPPPGATCFFLTNGPDLWAGTAAAECVNAAGGRDQITGAGGDDYVNGGAGDDWIVAGGAGDDCVIGGTGNDRLFGGNGDDTLDATTDGISGELMSGGAGTDACVDEGLGVFC